MIPPTAPTHRAAGIPANVSTAPARPLRRPRRSCWLAALFAVFLLASGCGVAAGDDGVVVLRFQSLSDQPAAIATTERIVAQWNATHPDVQVQITPSGFDSAYDKMITQFNGLVAPDVLHYEAAGIAPFARDGYLADLSEHLSAAAVADLPAGIRDAVTVDGRLIGYPTELQSYVVFANRTLLQQAGIPVPDGATMTWAELERIAAATTRDGVYGLGWGLSSPTAAFLALSPPFGGTWFDGTGRTASIRVGPGELAVPELVRRLQQAGTVSPVTVTQSGSEVLGSFYAGRIAMTVQGSFQAANIATDAPPDLDWVVLPPLAGPRGAAQVANPQTLSVNIDSANVAEATAFVEFFAGTENLAELSAADALIPATTSARDLLGERLAGQRGWDEILASGDGLTDSPYLFVDAYAQWKDTVATPAFQRYLAAESDTAGLTAELEQGWTEITD